MLSTYTLLKFLHIVAAIVWIGGVCTLTVLYTRLTRLQDRRAIAAVAQVSGFAGQVVVGPAMALTLIAGMTTASTAGFSFGALWITWGFSAVIVSIALGAIFIRRTTAQIVTLAATAEPTDQRMNGLQGRLTLFNLLNLAILLSTVWVMVAKPSL